MIVKGVRTISNLPAAADKYRNTLFWVIDGNSATDVATGGGTYMNLIACRGATFVVLVSAGQQD